jgi:hypothetical protein
VRGEGARKGVSRPAVAANGCVKNRIKENDEARHRQLIGVSTAAGLAGACQPRREVPVAAVAFRIVYSAYSVTLGDMS